MRLAPAPIFACLLHGIDPLQEKIPNYSVMQTVGKRLPSPMIDGVKLQGVQIRTRAFAEDENVSDAAQSEWTEWLEPSNHFLRRVQFAANDEIILNRFLDVKFNPDFPEDFLKFLWRC